MYRDEAPERVRDRVAERVAEIAREVNALDAELGAWGARVPDGSPAPPDVVGLMHRRDALTAELRALTGAESPPPKQPGLLARLLGRSGPRR